MFAIAAPRVSQSDGAAELRFRIIGKSYLLGDDNSNGTRLTGAEV